ncbi:MAG TPA: hypothetical protein VGP99_03550, partial [Tepidisphaeraceae bacterium]|nr:hypothetical protein [Tepidisphaeraceae bacterium]
AHRSESPPATLPSPPSVRDSSEMLTKPPSSLRSYHASRGLGSRYLGGGCFRPTVSASPTNQELVVTALAGNTSDLFILDLGTKQVTRITATPFWEMDALFLPSGQEILFRADYDNHEGELYTISSNGSQLRHVAPGIVMPSRHLSDLNAGISPDGKQIVFAGHHGNENDRIFMLRLSDPGQRALTSAEYESFSPVFVRAGSQVAFAQKRVHGFSVLWTLSVVGTEGKGQHDVLTDNIVRWPIGVLRDGVNVLVMVWDSHQPNAVELVNVNTSQVRPLLKQDANVGNFTVLPGKDVLVFASDKGNVPYRYDLWLLDFNSPSGAEPHRITQFAGQVASINARPDGRAVYIVVDEKGRRCGIGTIYEVSIPDGTIRELGRNYFE